MAEMFCETRITKIVGERHLDFPEIRGFPFFSYILGWDRAMSLQFDQMDCLYHLGTEIEWKINYIRIIEFVLQDEGPENSWKFRSENPQLCSVLNGMDLKNYLFAVLPK